jgi:hypothetical protein
MLAVQKPLLIQRVLWTNTAFSIFSGLLLIIAAQPIAGLLGVANPLIMAVLGGLIIGFGVVVYLIGRAPQPLPVAAVIALDVAWVVGSAAILFGNLLPLTDDGRWLILIVADIVLILAIAEIVGLRRMLRGS